MFEVEDLRYATLATVSRCGMVWFSEEVLTFDMICENFLCRLRKIPIDEGEGFTMGTPSLSSTTTASSGQASTETTLSPTLQVIRVPIVYIYYELLLVHATFFPIRCKMIVLISCCHTLLPMGL